MISGFRANISVLCCGFSLAIISQFCKMAFLKKGQKFGFSKDFKFLIKKVQKCVFASF